MPDKEFRKKQPLKIFNAENTLERKANKIAKRISHKDGVGLITHNTSQASEHGTDTLESICSYIQDYIDNPAIYYGRLDFNEKIFVKKNHYLFHPYSFFNDKIMGDYLKVKATITNMSFLRGPLNMFYGRTFDKNFDGKKMYFFIRGKKDPYDLQLILKTPYALDIYEQKAVQRFDKIIALSNNKYGKLVVVGAGNHQSFVSKLPILPFGACRFVYSIGGCINYVKAEQKGEKIVGHIVKADGTISQTKTEPFVYYSAKEDVFISDNPQFYMDDIENFHFFGEHGTSFASPRVASKSYLLYHLYAQHKPGQLSLLAWENIMVHSIDDVSTTIDGRSYKTKTYRPQKYIPDQENYTNHDVYQKRRKSKNTADTINGEGLSFNQNHGFGRPNLLKAFLIARSFPKNLRPNSEKTLSLTQSFYLKDLINSQSVDVSANKNKKSAYSYTLNLKMPISFLSRAITLRLNGNDVPRFLFDAIELSHKAFKSQFMTPLNSFNHYAELDAKKQGYTVDEKAYLTEDSLCNQMLTRRPYSVVLEKDEVLNLSIAVKTNQAMLQKIGLNKAIDCTIDIYGDVNHKSQPAIHSLTGYELLKRDKDNVLTVPARKGDWLHLGALVNVTFDEVLEGLLKSCQSYDLHKYLDALNTHFDFSTGQGEIREKKTGKLIQKIVSHVSHIITAFGDDKIKFGLDGGIAETWEGNDEIDCSLSSGDHRVSPGSGNDLVKCGVGQQIIVFSPTDFYQNKNDRNVIIGFDPGKDFVVFNFDSELNKFLINDRKKQYSLKDFVFERDTNIVKTKKGLEFDIGGAKFNFKDSKSTDFKDSVYVSVNTLDWFKLNVKSNKFEPTTKPSIAQKIF